MITEVQQERRFYRLSTGRAAHYENIKPHNPEQDIDMLSQSIKASEITCGKFPTSKSTNRSNSGLLCGKTD